MERSTVTAPRGSERRSYAAARDGHLGGPMPLSLEELLADPGLGLELRAGRRGLATRGPIRWAHISDNPDPTPWLEGGEVLLTTGLGVKDSPDLQRRLLANLDARGVAAVGFGVGVVVDDVPPTMLEAADDRSLPLFTVPYEVPFIAVTRRVAQATFEEHYATLRSAVDLHRQVLGAVVGGAGVDGVLDLVAKHLPAAAVVAYDYYGQVLGQRDPGERLARVAPPELWEAVAPGRHDRDRFEAVLDGQHVTGAVVRLGTAVEGVLALLTDRPLHEPETLLMEQGLTGLSLELARGQSIREARRVRVGELLEDVTTGHASVALVERQLERFGLVPTEPYRVLCLLPSGTTIRAVPTVAEDVLAATTPPVVGVHDGCVVAVVQPTTGDHAEQLARALRTRGVLGVRIGRSRPQVGGGQLRAGLREAVLAARRATGAGVADVAELGVPGLLAALDDDAAAAAFVDATLGPVLAHESAESTPLVASLRAYLRHGCRPGPAAEELRVHRHTLTYRLERIRELTGRDPRDGEHLLGYSLALELLDQRPELEGR